MKAVKKIDPQVNRERQATYRREMKRAGWTKVSFYLSPEERAELEEYRKGNSFADSIMDAVRESKFLRRQVAQMTGWEKFM